MKKLFDLPLVILMAMVSNHHLAGPDYFGPTGITIQSRLRESENVGRYDHAKILIRYEADWSNSSFNIHSQDMTFVEVPGNFSGTSFSANWDSTGSGDVHYSGHVNVSLDPNTMHVVSWSAQNHADQFREGVSLQPRPGLRDRSGEVSGHFNSVILLVAV